MGDSDEEESRELIDFPLERESFSFKIRKDLQNPLGGAFGSLSGLAESLTGRNGRLLSLFGLMSLAALLIVSFNPTNNMVIIGSVFILIASALTGIVIVVGKNPKIKDEGSDTPPS